MANEAATADEVVTLQELVLVAGLVDALTSNGVFVEEGLGIAVEDPDSRRIVPATSDALGLSANATEVVHQLFETPGAAEVMSDYISDFIAHWNYAGGNRSREQLRPMPQLRDVLPKVANIMDQVVDTASLPNGDASGSPHRSFCAICS